MIADPDPPVTVEPTSIPPITHGRVRSIDPELSITDFLTDGSLASLCAEITALTGVQVQLRDTKGNVIVKRESRLDGETAWKSVPLAQAPSVGKHSSEIPLIVSGITIGSFMVGEGAPSLASSDARQRLERAIVLLAGASAELCTHDLEVKHRVKALAALTRMSSLLVGSTAPDRVLEVALDSALEVLGLDAGAIVLFAEDSDGVLSTSDAAALSLGDQLMLVPGHCDPTVNLYDELVCIRGDRVEALWPIAARGSLL